VKAASQVPQDRAAAPATRIEELYGKSAPPSRPAARCRAPATVATGTAKSEQGPAARSPPKYRNPANAKPKTWTGRGKQPRWLAA
jgi:DNA-binding protein H-NS